MCMYEGFGLKIKHLDNLITKKTYGLFTQGEFSLTSHSGFRVLEYLYQHPGATVTQKDIEHILVINRATTSKMVKLLEDKGYIVRISSTEDGRCKELTLTPAGERLYLHNIEASANLDQFFSDTLSAEDFEAFEKIYTKLKEKLENT